MSLSLAPVLGVNLGSPVSGLRLRARPVPCALPTPAWLLGTSLCPAGAPPGTSQGNNGSDHRLGWWAGRCGCLPQGLEASKAVPGSLELLGVKGELGVRAWLLRSASRLEKGALGLRCCWQSGRAWRGGARQVDHGRARSGGPRGPPAHPGLGATALRSQQCGPWVQTPSACGGLCSQCPARLRQPHPALRAPEPSSARLSGAPITTTSPMPLGCRQPPTLGRRTRGGGGRRGAAPPRGPAGWAALGG